MPSSTKLNFVLQQGVTNVSAEGCELRFSALMFQPRVIGITALIALIFQSWYLFLALSIILWWSVFLPKLNPFDQIYNHFIARPRGLRQLDQAPAPRRFAQGMAATFMLGIALSLMFGWHWAAWIIEGFLVLALALLNLGMFCLGSYIYHLLRGNVRFANDTLPWSRRG
ncbi:MAG TPA: DUF4395 domain-containing protein [Geobacteraceae bacterium]|nr:DUF4395 domain-containing protein [Geobacteraceae bacterium]